MHKHERAWLEICLLVFPKFGKMQLKTWALELSPLAGVGKVTCHHTPDARTRWHMLLHAELSWADSPNTGCAKAGANRKLSPLWRIKSSFWNAASLVCMAEIGEDGAAQYLCQLSQCDKCAVRVLQLYLFAVWCLHDSRSVYEFLLEPDGCKATKRMPATYKCQMFKPLDVNIYRVCSQQCCRAQSQRQAAGLI